MFRSNEEAAIQRADALQRELDATRSENELLQRQLANAMGRLATVASVDTLQREVEQVSEQLASTQGLLVASENERRRLASLHPTPPRRARSIEYKNPGAGVPRPELVALAVFVAICLFIAYVGR